VTALVWFRRDLRVHDHPPLALALREHERVVPVFVRDRRITDGRFPSPRREAFLHGSLAALREQLRERGGELIVREGRPEQVLPELARATGATELRFASDVSPFARARDERVEQALSAAGIRPRRSGGNFVADTREEKPYRVFSPFHRRWRERPRRPVHDAPERVPVPEGMEPGEIPSASELEHHPAGELHGRRRMEAWLAAGVARYADGRRHDDMLQGTSKLSMHLHFGTISARELEERARQVAGRGPERYVRQLAWRDFYAHVLYHHPANSRNAMRSEPEWEHDDELVAAWAEGRTGYPIVDAGMRQLARTGFMDNRARLITASFLTKDLHQDWRAGEAHFMRLLLCGDEAQNNGNWQWIASTGVDPQPFYKRLYNPVLQQRRHDPEGAYVRAHVPELAGVPLERLAEPWRMTREEQRAARVEIGRDYPSPLVEHAAERRRAIERYRAVRT
jgi:deoxyribodipyrimidine photo-lyase